jgi:hypothetical protein
MLGPRARRRYRHRAAVWQSLVPNR